MGEKLVAGGVLEGKNKLDRYDLLSLARKTLVNLGLDAAYNINLMNGGISCCMLSGVKPGRMLNMRWGKSDCAFFIELELTSPLNIVVGKCIVHDFFKALVPSDNVLRADKQLNADFAKWSMQFIKMFTSMENQDILAPYNGMSAKELKALFLRQAGRRGTAGAMPGILKMVEKPPTKGVRVMRNDAVSFSIRLADYIGKFAKDRLSSCVGKVLQPASPMSAVVEQYTDSCNARPLIYVPAGCVIFPMKSALLVCDALWLNMKDPKALMYFFSDASRTFKFSCGTVDLKFSDTEPRISQDFQWQDNGLYRYDGHLGTITLPQAMHASI